MCSHDRSDINLKNNLNISSTLKIVDAAKKTVNKIIYISSIAASDMAQSNYGKIKFSIENKINKYVTIIRPGMFFENKKCEPNEEYEDVREDIELQIDSIRNVIRQYPIDNQTVDHECAHTQIVDHIKLLEIYNKQIEYQELEELKLVLSERYDTKTIKKLIGKLQYTKVPDIEVPNTEVSDTEVSHTQVSHTEVPYIGDGDTQCKTICNIM